MKNILVIKTENGIVISLNDIAIIDTLYEDNYEKICIDIFEDFIADLYDINVEWVEEYRTDLENFLRDESESVVGFKGADKRGMHIGLSFVRIEC